MNSTNKEMQAVTHPASEGSEIVSDEVNANTHKEASNFQKQPLRRGYTVDAEGNFNIYAIEPGVYEAGYPSSKQQRRYLYLGAAALLFVTFVIGIAFAAS